MLWCLRGVGACLGALQCFCMVQEFIEQCHEQFTMSSLLLAVYYEHFTRDSLL